MKIDINIDRLTPCLVEVSTGKVFQTVFSLVTQDDIFALTEKGWLFD